VGLLVIGGIAGGLFADRNGGGREAQEVPLAVLQQSLSGTEGWAFVAGAGDRPSFVVTLTGVRETDEQPEAGIPLPADARSVTFYLEYDNRMVVERTVGAGSIVAVVAEPGEGAFELKPAFATADGASLPAAVGARRAVAVEATFFVPDNATVLELRLDPPWRARDVAYRFQ
jgi:hypothetical protein